MRITRSLVTVALAAAVSTTAVGVATAGGDAPPADGVRTAGIACPGLPRGLALTGNGPRQVFRITRSGSKPLASVSRGVITQAVRGRDSTVWIEARPLRRPNGTWRRIVRVEADGDRRVSETGEVRLSHIGTGRGRTTVVTYIDWDRGGHSDPDVNGNVFVEYASGARRSLTYASGIESSVLSAAPAVHRVGSGRRKSVIALGWFVDLAEQFTYHRPDGGRVQSLFDPNEDAPYGQPPTYQTPILSPHGARLSWIEGPKISPQLGRLVGVWKLVVAGSRTGAESVRVKVGRNSEFLHHADYDGRYWVGTFSKRGDLTPSRSDLRIRIVDTWAADPQPVDPGCSLGFVASIDRFVKN